MKKLNIAIIGFGKVGKIRFKNLKKNKNIRKIYIFDKFKKVPDINKIDNVKKLLKLDISVVFICVPTYLADKYTSFFIEKNINVFCEKPPSTSFKKLLSIKRKLEKSKSKLAYGFNHRYHASISNVKNIIEKKKLGKILWIRCRYGKPLDKNYLTGWRGDKNKSGGGILIDQGIHVLDLLILFLGKITKVKSILTKNFLNKKIEDNAFIILQNRSKQTASMHSTLTQWRHIFSFEIFFQSGYITINGLKTPSGKYGNEEIVICKNTKKTPDIKWKILRKKIYKTDESFRIEVEEFLDSIQNNKKIKNGNIDDAINVMSLLDQIYKENKMK